MKRFTLPLALITSVVAWTQNIGINTDGSAPETGVVLDIKIPTDKATTAAVGTFFQLKSNNTSGNELKFRFGLKTDATQGNRYGFMDFPDYTAGTPAYLNLSLQPSGGNVGINTTAPGAPLQVGHGTSGTTGSANISAIFAGATTNVGDASGIQLNVSAQSSKAQILAGAESFNNSWMSFFTNTSTTLTEKMRITAAGYVGMGTQAPVCDLDITKAPSNGYVLAQVKNTAAGTGAGAGYITYNDASKWAEMTLGSSTATTTTFGYANANFANYLTSTTLALGSTAASPVIIGTNNLERMRVDASGNVGVGITAPANLLHVDLSAAAGNEVRVDKDVDWIGSGFTQLRLCGKTLPTHMLRIGYSTTGDFAVLQSQVSGAGIFNPIALNPNGGNVGVGVTSPSTKFEVYSNSSGGIRVYGPVSNVGGMIQVRDNDDAAATAWPGGSHVVIWPNNNGLGILRFVKSGISQWDFVDRSTVNTVAGRKFAIHDANGVGDIMTFWGNGSVGIGCSSPAYTLDVRGTLGVSGQITTSAAVVTTGVAACSDVRYKRNITPLQNSLNNVMKLQGVNYLWKQEEFPEKNFTGDVQVGFIAQELEKIYPQMVLTDKDGYKSVDYSRLTPVLVEAIKEQQKQIDELRLELLKMKAEKTVNIGTPVPQQQTN